MRHKRFPINALVVGGREISVRYCDLLVATNDESAEPDWECLASSNDEVQLAQAPYALELRSGSRAFVGDAILVRSDGLAHVFRGIGTLDGLVDDDLL